LAGGVHITTLDPQIAIAAVAIIGAFAHAIVAILRAVQDFRVAQIRAANGTHAVEAPDAPVTTKKGNYNVYP
jgi:hypothetical protein